MSKRTRILLIAPFALVGIAVFVFIGGQIVRLLWNALLPELFGLPQVTFWQALGLLALCRILFGGFGRHGGGPGSRMRGRMTERWDRMTPEERDRFRQGIRDRWGFGKAAGETKEL